LRAVSATRVLSIGRSRSGALRAVRSRLSRRDLVIVSVLFLVPVAIQLGFLATGRTLVPGDDLTQNYPLRVLAGEVIASGHLPAWDSYLWSGTPLLAGWNAGAMFPGTWLFAILPGSWAWAANMAFVGVAAGWGTYALCRRLGVREPASALASVVFSYTGFMSGQIAHLGLVQGTAMLPWTLLGIDLLARPASSSSTCSIRVRSAIGLLGISGALTMLAGDPRAVSTSIIASALFLAARSIGRPHARLQLLFQTTCAAALAVSLSAVQWVPGLAFLHGSQRGVSVYNFFASGSLAPGELAGLLVLPWSVGGNGNFGMASYAGSYNAAEVTIGVGIVASLAMMSLIPEALRPALTVAQQRLGSRRRSTAAGQTSVRRPIGVWYVIIVVGVLLTLGANTALGHVLVQIPLFGGERLQNRNMAMVDLALSVLLAYFLDGVFARGLPAPLRALDGRSARLLACVPLVWLATLALLALVDPHVVVSLVGRTSRAPGVLDELRPYFVISLVIDIALGGVVLGWRHLSHLARARFMCGFVVLDVATYVCTASYATAGSSTLATTNSLSSELAQATGASGRFALYNPDYSATGEDTAIDEVGVSDLDILRHQATVQGYGSIVQGAYQNATDTHAVEALDPSGLSSTTYDSLNLQTLLTLPVYLQTRLAPSEPIPLPAGSPGARAAASANGDATSTGPTAPSGPWKVTTGSSSSWLLASPTSVASLAVVLSADEPIRIGLTSSNRPTMWRTIAPGAEPTPASRAGNAASGGAALAPHDVQRRIDVAFKDAPKTERVVVAVPRVSTDTTSSPVVIDAIVVTTSSGSRLDLDGQLQGSLPSSSWSYSGSIGPFVELESLQSRGAAWLEAPDSSSADAPESTDGTVTTTTNATTGSETMHVTLSAPATLVRSVTYANGWIARITTRSPPGTHGRDFTESVRRVGLVQSIQLPAGAFTISWSYAPNGLTIGLVLTLAGTGSCVLLACSCLMATRRSWSDKPRHCAHTARA